MYIRRCYCSSALACEAGERNGSSFLSSPNWEEPSARATHCSCQRPAAQLHERAETTHRKPPYAASLGPDSKHACMYRMLGVHETCPAQLADADGATNINSDRSAGTVVGRWRTLTFRQKRTDILPLALDRAFAVCVHIIIYIIYM